MLRKIFLKNMKIDFCANFLIFHKTSGTKFKKPVPHHYCSISLFWYGRHVSLVCTKRERETGKGIAHCTPSPSSTNNFNDGNSIVSPLTWFDAVRCFNYELSFLKQSMTRNRSQYTALKCSLNQCKMPNEL